MFHGNCSKKDKIIQVVISHTKRFKRFRGSVASTTWDLHLRGALGVKLHNVPNTFALMTIITGIGQSNLFLTDVCVGDCSQWFLHSRVLSTSENGSFSMYHSNQFDSNRSQTVHDISSFFSGLHHDSENCDPINFVTKIHQIFRKAKRSHRFYPTNLKLIPASFIKAPISFRSNGGWSDIRDHNLCLSFIRDNQ